MARTALAVRAVFYSISSAFLLGRTNETMRAGMNAEKMLNQKKSLAPYPFFFAILEGIQESPIQRTSPIIIATAATTSTIVINEEGIPKEDPENISVIAIPGFKSIFIIIPPIKINSPIKVCVEVRILYHIFEKL